MVQPHNELAGQAWGHSGIGWEWISFGLSDGIGHAVQKLAPAKADRVLDIGTGTGWAARLAAGLGADVTAVDIADGLLEAANELSAHLQIDFRHADAEALPFEDASFDGVLSTYGVMFAQDQLRAVSELARVCKPDGRIALTTWEADPDSYIPAFFGLVGHYGEASPPDPSPMNWGDRGWLMAQLGSDFDLYIEALPTTLFAPSAEVVWQKYLAGFGPLSLTYDALSADRQTAMKQAFLDLHEPYQTANGLRIERKALLISGRRR